MTEPVPDRIVGLERLSQAAAQWAASSWGFAVALGAIAVGLILGAVYGFSQRWFLVINTGAPLVTFLMVFLIQRSQSKDTRALHLKLNELLASVAGASNRLVSVETLSEEALEGLHVRFQRLAAQANRDPDTKATAGGTRP